MSPTTGAKPFYPGPITSLLNRCWAPGYFSQVNPRASGLGLWLCWQKPSLHRERLSHSHPGLEGTPYGVLTRTSGLHQPLPVILVGWTTVVRKDNHIPFSEILKSYTHIRHYEYSYPTLIYYILFGGLGHVNERSSQSIALLSYQERPLANLHVIKGWIIGDLICGWLVLKKKQLSDCCMLRI
jgi:hypothetical protein